MSLIVQDPTPAQTDKSPVAEALTPPADASVIRRTKYVTKWRVVAVVVLTALLFHRPLLHGAFLLLVAQDNFHDAQYAVIINSDQESFECGASLISEKKARAILIVERRPERIVRSGIVPSLATTAREELLLQGVPESAIHVLSTNAATSWQVVRELDLHLQSTAPKTEVVFVCPILQSRYFRHIIDSTVDQERGHLFLVKGFEPHGIDADNWWHNRLAIAKVAMSYLRLAYVMGYGEGTFDQSRPDPDECVAPARGDGC